MWRIVTGSDTLCKILVTHIVTYDALFDRRLLRGGSDARYVPTGHLVYAVADALFAVPFDLSNLEVKGGPVPIVNGVQRASTLATNTAAANFCFSDGGALVYLNSVAASAPVQTTLGVVDRNGAVRRLDVPLAIYRNPRVSPDGRQVAVETIADTGQGIIWVYDLSGRTAIRRLTQEAPPPLPKIHIVLNWFSELKARVSTR